MDLSSWELEFHLVALFSFIVENVLGIFWLLKTLQFDCKI